MLPEQPEAAVRPGVVVGAARRVLAGVDVVAQGERRGGAGPEELVGLLEAVQAARAGAVARGDVTGPAASYSAER